jgi:membrane protein
MTANRWRPVALATLRAGTSDQLALAAAGCAFFATLALFPAMSTLIALYGLLASPRLLEHQILWLHDLLPGPAFWLIANRLAYLARQPSAGLGFSLAISLLLCIWSSALSIRAMLTALSRHHDEARQRNGFGRFRVALALTALAIVVTMLALGVLVCLPALLHFAKPWSLRVHLVHLSGAVLLFGCAVLFVAGIYRVGLAREYPVLPGTMLALIVCGIASVLLSSWIDYVVPFRLTFGPFAAFAAIMLWFFVTAHAVLLGAELNAQLASSRTSLPIALVVLPPSP